MRTQTDRSEAASTSRRWRVPGALALLIFAIGFPIAHPTGEQQASRYALTASLWDNGTVSIEEYTDFVGRDRAVREGVTYSDKAPGQPFLAVPFYGVYRISGGDSVYSRPLEPEHPDFPVWWLTVWSSLLPAAVLVSLMYWWVRSIEPRYAVVASLSTVIGTMLIVFATLLYGHVLAAVLLFGMFLVVRRPDATHLAMVFAGALGGAAVLVEYPMLLVVGVVALGALTRHRRRGLLLAVGGLPMALLGAWYNLRVTGDPLTVPYQWTAFSGPVQQEQETLHMFSGPSFDRLLHLLFSERGLIVATPLVVIALVGMWLLFRRRHGFDAAIAMSALVAMIGVQMAWGNSFAGGPGPRYIVPALPFLAAPLAVAWARWRRLTSLLVAVSAATMMSAMLTRPQLGSDFPAGLGDWLATLLAGMTAPSWYSEVLGPPGWVLYGFSVIGAAALLVRVARKDQPELQRSTDVKSTSTINIAG